MNALAMAENILDDESYGASIDISIRENKEMLEPTIMEQLVEDKISVDNKVQKIEDDDSIKLSSRSLGLGYSSSSSFFSSTSSSDEDITKQSINKRRTSTRKNRFQRPINIRKIECSSINCIIQ